jgi:ABC-type phosphate transport system auxiliary subunit
MTRRTSEEVEQLRRSIAMLQPGAHALDREGAMRLLAELGDVERRLDRLQDGLRALLSEDS